MSTPWNGSSTGSLLLGDVFSAEESARFHERITSWVRSREKELYWTDTDGEEKKKAEAGQFGRLNFGYGKYPAAGYKQKRSENLKCVAACCVSLGRVALRLLEN